MMGRKRDEFNYFVLMSVFVMSAVRFCGKKYIRPIWVIKSKKKYEIIKSLFIVGLGSVIVGVIHLEKNSVIAGVCFGAMEGFVQLWIGYEPRKTDIV